MTRVSTFGYDGATDFLLGEVVEPDVPGLTVTTGYTLDRFGNRLTTTVSAAGLASRSASTAYSDGASGTPGRFVVATSNALGHTATQVADPLLGVVTSATDANGVAASVTYDGFGRKLT